MPLTVTLASAEGPMYMKNTIRDCPALFFLTYDSTKHAPASEGDVLGFIRLSCVMQNMWLTVLELEIGLQILNADSTEHPKNYLRVRRDAGGFPYCNRYGIKVE